MEKFKKLSVKKIGQLPKTSGVYLFYLGKEIIYIGKAVNIKARVKNHFSQPSYRDNLFIDKVDKVGFIETNSEIEALILEAELIKKHKPKFNVVWRDDKNYFYVALARNKEKMPYVFITHQPKEKITNYKLQITNKFKITNSKFKTEYVGPFVEGGALKKTLKYLRRVFPFYTRSASSGQASFRHPKQKCQWCHLDLCPGPNPDIKKYKSDIKKLELVLRGKRKSVLSSLKKEMKAFSNSQEFENAKKVRDKIFALENVMSHAHVITNITSQKNIEGSELSMFSVGKWQKTEKLMKEILKIKGKIKRIECYDVSNIQGKQATGSMVVFKNGQPDKSQYKKFRIRMKQEPDDIAMLKEVLQRRFSHPEWPYPEIILIDGGKAQLNTAINVRGQMSDIRCKIISIAKGRQELFIEDNPPSHKASERQRKNPIPLKQLPQEVYNLIKHLDNEAHRFAISYHRKLRMKNLLDKVK